MLKIVMSVFIVLHGLVHLLYFAQSRRLFELRPGMVWPDGAWAFSKLIGDEATRSLASISLVLVATGFVAGGVGMLISVVWWRPVILVSAIFSVAVFILFWNGEMRRLDDQGAIGILIDILILGSLLVFS